MSHQIAQIYYHIDLDQKQEILIDADNVKGNIVFPPLDKKDVKIRDLRISREMPSFERDSIEFFDHETSVDSFYTSDFEPTYNLELVKLLKDKLSIKEAIIFDHTIREDKKTVRPPARHAHIDYSDRSTREQIERFVDKERRALWLEGHYAIVNIWRPLENIVKSAPLGFLHPMSLGKQDLIEIDLNYPNRKGEVIGCLYNSDHEWIYLSDMRPDEVVLFNMFDSESRGPVVHSAFDLKDSHNGAIRKSIESRILIRY